MNQGLQRAIEALEQSISTMQVELESLRSLETQENETRGGNLAQEEPVVKFDEDFSRMIETDNERFTRNASVSSNNSEEASVDYTSFRQYVRSAVNKMF